MTPLYMLFSLMAGGYAPGLFLFTMLFDLIAVVTFTATPPNTQTGKGE